jgi:hypothetical protein
LIDHACQVLLAGERVLRRIDADGFEHFGMFPEAVPLEASFGEFAAILIPGTVV